MLLNKKYKKGSGKILRRVLTWVGVKLNPCARNVIKIKVGFFPALKMANLASREALFVVQLVHNKVVIPVIRLPQAEKVVNFGYCRRREF